MVPKRITWPVRMSVEWRKLFFGKGLRAIENVFFSSVSERRKWFAHQRSKHRHEVRHGDSDDSMPSVGVLGFGRSPQWKGLSNADSSRSAQPLHC